MKGKEQRAGERVGQRERERGGLYHKESHLVLHHAHTAAPPALIQLCSLSPSGASGDKRRT